MRSVDRKPALPHGTGLRLKVPSLSSFHTTRLAVDPRSALPRSYPLPRLPGLQPGRSGRIARGSARSLLCGRAGAFRDQSSTRWPDTARHPRLVGHSSGRTMDTIQQEHFQGRSPSRASSRRVRRRIRLASYLPQPSTDGRPVRAAALCWRRRWPREFGTTIRGRPARRRLARLAWRLRYRHDRTLSRVWLPGE